ncbi:MAG TPA: FxSxx-COOH system tetratricopeptide repeat protein [Ktedonobacteraceae bacterium]|jgi:tetratricopeptide (TPR) repeat protein
MTAQEVWSGVWDIPYQRNRFFTGREEIFTALVSALQADRAAALTPPQGLSGLGGMGKTQTAVEYAYRFRAHYQALLWVRANSPAVLVSEFLRLATVLQLPARMQRDQRLVIEAVVRWLREHDGWLLIFDDVENPAHLDPFLPGTARGHILLTSRASAFGGLAQSIPLAKMADEVGALFLLRRTEHLALGARLAEAPAQQRADALRITYDLAGLPLALEQAGAYIQSMGCTLAAYHTLLGERLAEVLAERSPQAQYPATVATTWALSFEKVAQAEPACPELLAALAFLYPEAVPEEILTEGHVHLGELLGAKAADPLLWDGVIAQLLRFSLIARSADDRLFTMHRLVQAVIQDRLEPAVRYLWSIRVVQAVADSFPAVQFETWPLCERYLIQAQTCASLIETWELMFSNAARLLNQTAAYLRHRARYTEAEPLYLRAIVIWHKTLGAEHPHLAACFNNLGRLYEEQGKYQQAEHWYRLALDLWTHLRLEDERMAKTLNNLGQLYRLQGKFREAEPFYQRSLHLREQVLGPDHPDTATACRNLAWLALELGQDQQAEQLLQRALVIGQRTQAAGHPDLATCLAVLADIASRRGRYEEAERLLGQVLAHSEQTYGQQHPETAVALNNLALSAEKRGNYEQAEALYMRAHAIHLQVFGHRHPRTAGTLTNLAGYYSNRGDDERAIACYQEAADLFEELLGPDHPRTAIVVNNLAEVYRRQEAFTQAEPLYRRALAIFQQVHGPEHAYTLRAQSNLALLLYEQGAYIRAAELLQQNLLLRQRVLGAAHPDVATSMQNLAMCARMQQRDDEAQALYRGALAIWQQDPHHHQPQLAVGLHNLALCLTHQGHLQEARVLYQQAIEILRTLVDESHPDMQTLLRHYQELLALQEAVDR